MTQELNLSPEHWNMWGASEEEEEAEADDAWSYRADKETYHDLWKNSTHSLGDMLSSVIFGSVDDSIQDAKLTFNGSLSVSNEYLLVEEKSSFLYGRCAVIKAMGSFTPTFNYVDINMR